MSQLPPYSLMAPIMTPFTKYFCRNGYRNKIGGVATIIVAYLMVSPTGILSPPTEVIIAGIVLDQNFAQDELKRKQVPVP